PGTGPGRGLQGDRCGDGGGGRPRGGSRHLSGGGSPSGRATVEVAERGSDTRRRGKETDMEIVVTGRNSEISERFRAHVAEKLQRIEKFDGRQRINRVEVEVTHA